MSPATPIPLPTVAGVVLAAGRSRRLGRPKALLEIEGEPLVHRTVRIALKAGLKEVVVVLGHRAEETGEAISDLEARSLVHSGFDAGQGSSVAAGLREMGPSIDAAIVIPCDHPFLTPGLLSELVVAFGRGDRDLIVPTHAGHRRSPVLVGRALFPRLMSLQGDRGARQLFDLLEHRLRELPIDDGSPLEDIDTRDDYERLLGVTRRPPPD